MIDHNIGQINEHLNSESLVTESEEMYLITIARLLEEGAAAPIPVSSLAAELAIQPISANQMVHKLAEEGLVAYEPYKGVELTGEGSRIASVVLRHRRLWEVFLVEHLGVSPGQADALACRFEHITPKMVIEQLDAFLGRPGYSPQGLAIPPAGAQKMHDNIQALAEVPIGQEREVIRVEGDGATRAFLESAGLRPGIKVNPLAVSEDGAMLLNCGPGRINLAAEVVQSIVVEGRRDRESNQS